jgi:Kef-type K+ transport system membrane component KefB
LAESALAAVLVGGGMLLLGQAWQPAVLLGVISMATAPASTLMVVRESDSAGPLTETLLGIIAVNNLLCLTAFALAAAVIDLTAGQQGAGFADALYTSAFWLTWQLLGSAALGYLGGLLLASWSTRVEEGGEMLILLAGSILLCVGASRALQLSPLITSIAVGATIANLTRHSDRLFETLAGTDPPFYAVFFVLAGAELDVRRIPEMGALGLAYVVGRTLGKILGARVVAGRLQLEAALQNYLGLALLAQAGLAVGLTLAVNHRYQAFAPTISTIVLASVAVFEVVGPSTARFALTRAGEVGRARRMRPRL